MDVRELTSVRLHVLMDGFDRSWYAVSRDAAFAAIAKAPAEKIDAWAKARLVVYPASVRLRVALSEGLRMPR